MLIAWIWQAMVWIAKLLIPAPPSPVIPKIDPNAPCPACGSTAGHIRAIVQNSQPFIRHECQVCLAWWLENPVSRLPYIGAKPELVNKAS